MTLPETSIPVATQEYMTEDEALNHFVTLMRLGAVASSMESQVENLRQTIVEMNEAARKLPPNMIVEARPSGTSREVPLHMEAWDSRNDSWFHLPSGNYMHERHTEIW